MRQVLFILFILVCEKIPNLWDESIVDLRKINKNIREKKMGVENMTIDTIAEKFKEILEVIEERCIKKNANFRTIVQEDLYISEEYARNIFGKVARMGVNKYILRRRMTEIYNSMDNFESLKVKNTVKEIKRYKEKMKREFGNPPRNLQYPLSTHNIEEQIEEDIMKNTMRNIGKKSLIALTEGRKKVEVEERIRLVDDANNILFDLDATYFVFRNRNIILKGHKPAYALFNSWLTEICGKEVHYLVKQEPTTNQVIQELLRYRNGETLYPMAVSSLKMEACWKEGRESSDLITQITYSNKYIKKIDFSNKLVFEENGLYLTVN